MCEIFGIVSSANCKEGKTYKFRSHINKMLVWLYLNCGFNKNILNLWDNEIIDI